MHINPEHKIFMTDFLYSKQSRLFYLGKWILISIFLFIFHISISCAFSLCWEYRYWHETLSNLLTCSMHENILILEGLHKLSFDRWLHCYRINSKIEIIMTWPTTLHNFDRLQLLITFPSQRIVNPIYQTDLELGLFSNRSFIGQDQ